MWILKENNEKATGGKKNCFSKDSSIEKTQSAVTDHSDASRLFIICMICIHCSFAHLDFKNSY